MFDISEDVLTHFHREVLPSYFDYVSIRRLNVGGDDLRKAMHAAFEISHFRERLPSPYNNKDNTMKLCPDYRVLSETVDAYYTISEC